MIPRVVKAFVTYVIILYIVKELLNENNQPVKTSNTGISVIGLYKPNTSDMRLITLLILSSLIFFTACDETQQDLQSNIETATEYILGEVTYFDVFNYVDKILRDSVLNAQGFNRIDSAVVTMSSPTMLTIDFGNGVQCPDGKTRSGSLGVTLSGPYAADTVSATVSLNNYTVQGRTIAGQIDLHKDFQTADKDLEFVVTNGSLTDSLGNVSTWQATQNLRWVDGLASYGNTSDDIYNVLSGSTTDGTAYNGQGFSASVSSNLIIDRSCKWIGQGLLTMSLPGATVESGEVDFGNGDCDSKLIISFDGSSFPYYMD